ncbi:MAG: hypothetical protein GX316_10680 [Firmicutes bacterium]|nr:hypothetical protein [Bacillota bacterium]
MKNERMQILHMLKEEKISVDEANSLLEALGTGKPADKSGSVGSEIRGRFIRIRVAEKGSERVNISVPLKLVDVIVRLVPKNLWPEGMGPVDWEEIVRLVQEGAEGKLLDVTDEDGTHVEIVVQ